MNKCINQRRLLYSRSIWSDTSPRVTLSMSHVKAWTRPTPASLKSELRYSLELLSRGCNFIPDPKDSHYHLYHQYENKYIRSMKAGPWDMLITNISLAIRKKKSYIVGYPKVFVE